MIRAGAGAAGIALAIAVATALLVQPPDSVRLEVGGLASPFLGAGWSESLRTDLHREAGALDPASARPDTRVRFRSAMSGSTLRLPLRPREGPVRLTLRAMARVRTAVTVNVAGAPAGRLSVPRGPWAGHPVELQAAAQDEDGLALTLGLTAQPLVRVPDEYVAQPLLWVASLEAAAPGGFAFTSEARATLGAVPLVVFGFGVAVGAGAWASLVAALLAGLGTAGLAQEAPLPLLVAVPRLLPCALLAGLFARSVVGRSLPAGARAALGALVAVGVLAHGSLAFVPGYDPGDLEIHVRRARDLGAVPLEYDALLRYGSHLPTPSQTFGEATEALGAAAPIPYSPLPYLAYYAAQSAGADLYWAMPVINTVLAMALCPWLFLVATRVFSIGGAWLASLLYVLDLPVWHHIARCHAPAAFGMALAPAALLLLAHEAERLDAPRRAVLCGAALGVAVLGYSTLVVLVGLFGLVLLALLAIDASGLTREAKRGVVLTLVTGGLLAGGLYYFHYVPGLLRGLAGAATGPDLHEGRTFLIFHNESRPSLRVWAAGFLLPLLLGLAAAPFALSRARASARPVLGAWLAAWALTMIAKEPFLFPRPLRWAKEDQFVSPLLALLIGAAVWSLPWRWLRWGAAAVTVAVALWLQLGDFWRHASGLWP